MRKHVVVALLVLGVASAILGTSAFGATTLVPTKLNAHTTPSSRKKSPYRYKTSGNVVISTALICPAGQTNPAYCTKPPTKCSQGLTPSFVAISFKAGRKTLSLRRVAVGMDCTYSSTVTFKKKTLRKFKSFRSKKGLKIRVSATFLGDSTLAPANARSQTVKARGK